MSGFLILHDNRGYVACSLLPNAIGKIDIGLLKQRLEQGGNEVEVLSLHDISFPSKYGGWYVIYPSSEDYGLFYKEFIEDILLRLQIDGAILLPRFELFRAHHNKMFMELYRTKLSDPYRTLQSKYFYSVKDMEKVFNEDSCYPVVLKTSAGSGSAGVALAYNSEQAKKKAKKMGKIAYFNHEYSLKKHVRLFLGRIQRKLTKRVILEHPKGRQKMIAQAFVPNLVNDYKVLIFADKYYLLRRKVRNHDFRASGSGKLEFPETFSELEKCVLDFAKGAYEELHTPMLSVDIAYDGQKCHMIEFQCLNFGPYTLQFSNWYYTKQGGKWKKVDGKSILEEEMAYSYLQFVKEQ